MWDEIDLALIEGHHRLEREVLSALSVDPADLRRSWRAALKHAGPTGAVLPMPRELPATLASPIGTGLSRRLGHLFELEPRPPAIPDPPPWDTADLFGFRWRSGPSSMLSAAGDDWQALARQTIAVRGPVNLPERRWAVERVLTDNQHKTALEHLDCLTATAAGVLLPALSGRRSIPPGVGPAWGSMVRLELPGYPDLAVAGAVVEVKSAGRPILPGKWLAQLATYALMDLDDVWGLETVALYQARWAVLFEIDLGQLIFRASTRRGLRRARDQYRVVVDSYRSLHRTLAARRMEEGCC